jgi:two-component system, NtrC family, response regulator AtoC
MLAAMKDPRILASRLPKPSRRRVYCCRSKEREVAISIYGYEHISEPESSGVTGSARLVGSYSESMKALERAMERIAPMNLPVLLVGESGTGKAFIAHRLHQLSSRRDDPFLQAICSDLTAEAVDQHFDGSASGHRNGSAGSGTLFLKEIGELSSANQRSLLHAILEGDSEAGGKSGGLRLVSSTTVDLEEEMAASRFRRDLYYRLRGACLHLPPLRERKEDVPALAEALLRKHAMLQGQTCPALDSEDFSLLQEWHWPGNIRELDNVIKQIVVLNDAKSVLSGFLIVPKEERKSQLLPNRLALKAATRAASRQVEKTLILDALAKTRWNRKRAAQELQISYKSLLSKLKQIGGEKPRKS